MENKTLPKVAFLGPSGTFSHQATYNYFGDNFQYHPEPTISKVFASLSASIPFACIPLANSTHGPVIETLDLLRLDRWWKDAFIRGEITIKIEHCLVVAGSEGVTRLEEGQDSIGDIATVYSHEQALGQCSGWLDRHLPNAKRVKVESTAEAARRVSETKQDMKNREAAICSEICLHTYPTLKLVKRGIQDRSDNQTRFAIVGYEVASPPLPIKSGPSRALLRVEIRQGDLSTMLSKFLSDCNSFNISIERIDRRPHISAGVWSDVYFLEVKREVQDDSYDIFECLDYIEASIPAGTYMNRLGIWR